MSRRLGGAELHDAYFKRRKRAALDEGRGWLGPFVCDALHGADEGKAGRDLHA